MSRMPHSRSTIWSLVGVLALSAAGSVASGQPGLPPPDSHGYHGHDDGHDHGHGHGARAPAAPKVYSPEDVARRSQVLAKVEGVEITVGTVEDYIDQQSPMLRARYKDPDELKKLLDNMVRFELLAAEAERRGYGKNKAVVRTVKDSAVQNLVRAEVEEKVTPQSVSEDEIKAYYESHPEEFNREAQRRVSHILVETEAEAKELIAEVQKADARTFIELAKKHSKDLESKMRGGDLGFFPKVPAKTATETTQVPDAVRKVAFELKNVGDTHPRPIAVEGGFSIVRLTGERPARHTSLKEAEHPIRTKLWREKRQEAMNALVQSLREKEKPQVFAERADWVKFDDMETKPSGFAPNPHKKPDQAGDGAGTETPAGHP